MPVQTRSQTANNATAPALKPAPKIKIFPGHTEEDKKAYEEYKRYSIQRYIDNRNKLIEENNYANSEVFAVLREARQTLDEDDFISLVFLLESLSSQADEVKPIEYDEEEALVLLPWFRRLFDLLASGKTTFELVYLKDQDDTIWVRFYTTWEHMDDMVRLHYSKIFPIWDRCPFSEIEF